MFDLKKQRFNIHLSMSCPVVRAINGLYEAYDYSQSSRVEVLEPSGFSGGGSTPADISMESAKFYITMRKLQFARAELITSSVESTLSPVEGTLSPVEGTPHQDSSTLSPDSSIKSPVNNTVTDTTDITFALIDSPPASTDIITGNSVYFERMFKDYYGKTSEQVLEKIVGASLKKLYVVITRVVDIVDIMEGLCISKLSRDFPSGMSLPTVYFDPVAIENIGTDDATFREINKIIDYANKLSVGGIRTKIEPAVKFDKKLRKFTFTMQDGSLAGYKILHELDMEIADYAYSLEQYHCDTIKKLSEVMNLCQQIIDLGV